MWPSRPIPGNPLQTHLDDRRSGTHLPSLLLVLAMSRRPVSGGCRTGHRKYGVFSRGAPYAGSGGPTRSEVHTSELQSRSDLVCRLLLEKKKKKTRSCTIDIKKKKNKK